MDTVSVKSIDFTCSLEIICRIFICHKLLISIIFSSYCLSFCQSHLCKDKHNLSKHGGLEKCINILFRFYKLVAGNETGEYIEYRLY